MKSFHEFVTEELAISQRAQPEGDAKDDKLWNQPRFIRQIGEVDTTCASGIRFF